MLFCDNSENLLRKKVKILSEIKMESFAIDQQQIVRFLRECRYLLILRNLVEIFRKIFSDYK